MKRVPIIAATLLCLLPCASLHSDAQQSNRPDPKYYILKDVPDFYFGGDPYRVDPYIRVAARIQEMGKKNGSYFLLSLTNAPDKSYATFILARMLFVPKRGKEFRRPYIGGTHFAGGTDYADWPLEPITLVDGVPFLISSGYILTGVPESPGQYIKYCIENCDWNPVRYKPKSNQEKKRALEKLLTSRKWKKPLESYAKNALASQID